MNSTIPVNINDAVFREATNLAKAKGISLSSLVESLLSAWTEEQILEAKIKNYPVSDDIKRLQGSLKVSGDAMSCLTTPEDLKELKEVLSKFFAARADRELDRLWDEGVLNQEVLNKLRSQHLRTPYISNNG